MRAIVRAAGVLAMAAAVVVSGCGKAKEKASEKMMEAAIKAQGGGDAKVDLAEGKYSVKTKDGSVDIAAGGNAKIPENFPSDIYVVKGAKVLMAAASGDGFMLNLETRESVDQVDAACSKEMKSQGWNVEATMNMGEQRTTAFKKGERQCGVTLTKVEQGTQIVLSVSGK